MEISGGCVCGGTRYVLKSLPVALVDCHCTDCRRSAGAPYVQWGSVPRPFQVQQQTRTFCPSISVPQLQTAGAALARH